jgi:hypothetical protein
MSTHFSCAFTFFFFLSNCKQSAHNFRFHEDIGRFAGGREALFASGFALVHRPPELQGAPQSAATAVVGVRRDENESGAPLATHGGERGGSCGGGGVERPAAAAAQLEAVAVLREPDPFTDLNGWTAWFYNLKACAAEAARAAEACGAPVPSPHAPPPAWTLRQR